MEKSTVIGCAEEICRVDIGKPYYDKEDQSPNQQGGGNILEQRDDTVAPDGQQEKQSQQDSAGKFAVLREDRPEAAEIAGQGQGIPGAAKGSDHIGPPAVAGQERRQQHTLHAVIASVNDEDSRQGEIIPVSEEHIEHADDGDRQNGTAGFGNRGTQGYEDAGAYRPANAQADNVP